MKYSLSLLFFLLYYSSIGYCQDQKNYLFKIHQGQYDEVGVECGYINTFGDTIIPLGKYLYCYTDTLRSYAIVLKHGGECIAIDRNCNELFEVKWFDNGPDIPQEGLFRIIKNGKTGYANTKGEIVIEPRFECTTPFIKGKAKVAYRCKLIQDGEHYYMKSDEWFYIDRTGKKIEPK